MLEITEPSPEGKPSWLASETGEQFTFRKPPNAAWWRRKHGLKKQTAELCFLLQLRFSQGNIDRLGKRYFVERAATLCGDLAGISIRTFERAIKEAKATGLITCEPHLFGERGNAPVKCPFIRPTDKFLQPFGVTLFDYDTWGRLAKLKPGRPKKGDLASSEQVMSPEEINACERWERALDKNADAAW